MSGYVKQLFRRHDFPKEIYVALDDGAMAFTGDLIWPNIECEHPFDFVPIARFDTLILNIPTVEAFLKALGVTKLGDVAPEAEEKFWNAYEFQFAETAAGNVKLTWV